MCYDLYNSSSDTVEYLQHSLPTMLCKAPSPKVFAKNETKTSRFHSASCLTIPALSSICIHFRIRELRVSSKIATMAGPPHKKQKREEYRKAQQNFIEGSTKSIDLPKKKFYRQRAHANPFSDHNLT
jgi:hypothetical protein